MRLYIQTVFLARCGSGSLSEVVLNKGEPGTLLSLFSVRAVAGLPVKSVCVHVWGPAVRMWWECEVVAGRTAAGHSNDGCPLSHSPRGHSQFLSLLLSSFPRSSISSVAPHQRTTALTFASPSSGSRTLYFFSCIITFPFILTSTATHHRFFSLLPCPPSLLFLHLPPLQP